jgi:hypothetical protein
MLHVLRFTASNLAHELAAQRHYSTLQQGIEIDPRFLVFEFVANIVLRCVCGREGGWQGREEGGERRAGRKEAGGEEG